METVNKHQLLKAILHTEKGPGRDQEVPRQTPSLVGRSSSTSSYVGARALEPLQRFS